MEGMRRSKHAAQPAKQSSRKATNVTQKPIYRGRGEEGVALVALDGQLTHMRAQGTKVLLAQAENGKEQGEGWGKEDAGWGGDLGHKR